jgi:hypothetical protein
MFFANSLAGFSYTMVIARGGAAMRHVRNLLFLAVTALTLTGCNLTQLLPRVEINASFVKEVTRTQVTTGTTGTTTTTVTSNIPVSEITLTDEAESIPTLALVANARPGSLGAFVDSYTINYLDEKKNPIIIKVYDPSDPEPDLSKKRVLREYTAIKTGKSNMTVPGGFTCTSTPLASCSVNSPDYQPVPGPSATSTPFQSMDVDVFAELLRRFTEAGGKGFSAFAEVSLDGRDTNGNGFSYKALIPIAFR